MNRLQMDRSRLTSALEDLERRLRVAVTAAEAREAVEQRLPRVVAAAIAEGVAKSRQEPPRPPAETPAGRRRRKTR